MMAMALTPWEPFEELIREPGSRLRDASRCATPWTSGPAVRRQLRGPRLFELVGRALPVDVREMDTAFVIEASLPGIKPAERQITATENAVTARPGDARARGGDQADGRLRAAGVPRGRAEPGDWAAQPDCPHHGYGSLRARGVAAAPAQDRGGQGEAASGQGADDGPLMRARPLNQLLTQAF